MASSHMPSKTPTRCNHLVSLNILNPRRNESRFDAIITSATQKSILKLLNSLEAISREISEGKAVDWCHASTVVDILEHTFNWIEIVQNCGLLPTLTRDAPGDNGTHTEPTGQRNSKIHKKKCFNQMRGSLARLSLYPEDLHCRADFVNAAVESMDFLIRQLFTETDTGFCHIPQKCRSQPIPGAQGACQS
jgi:hypothetical protein